MKKNNITAKYLSINPFKKGSIEAGIIIISGVISLIFEFIQIASFPLINIIGGVLIIVSFIIHGICGKHHKQAHVDTTKITTIVSKGIYSKLRHPMYLSLIIMNIGIALVFNSWLALLLSIIFSISWFFVSLKEEEILLKTLKTDYQEYKKNVPWRIIPEIF